MNPNTLVLVALRRDHYVGLVQHKHRNFLHVQHFELQRPVKHFSRRADDYVIVDNGPTRY